MSTRRVLAIAATVAVAATGALAGFAASGTAPPRAALEPSPVPKPLLGLVGRALVELDPLTLEQRGRRKLVLPGNVAAWSFSPDRRQLVLGDNGYGRLYFVDAVRLRRVATVQTTGLASALAWVGSRLMAVTAWARVVRVQIIDANRRNLLRTLSVNGSLVRPPARTPNGLALLLGPADSIGPATLAVVDAQGGARMVTLARIPAGFDYPEDDQEAPMTRLARPGLTIDPAGRAFVVGAGRPVAEVDLATLAVTYHDLSEPITLLGGLRDWLEPRAQAKGVDGPNRSALWLGGGILGVSGADDHGWVDVNGRIQTRQTAAGAKLIDTRRWTVTTLDAQATWLGRAGDGLMTETYLWDSSTGASPTGTGVTVYNADGSPRFHLFESEAVSARAVGERLFVRRLEPQGRYAIVDLRSGAVVRVVRRELPFVLVDGGL